MPGVGSCPPLRAFPGGSTRGARSTGQFPIARREAYSGHPLARFIREDAAEEVQEALASDSGGMQAHGSAGAGRWAAVPWIAVFDELVTASATRGYYLVFLFHISRPIVHLSLNQGTTATRAEFKGRTREVLRDRAALMRRRLQEFHRRLNVTEIEVGSEALLPGDYVAGHALGVSYDRSSLPSELVLRDDLITAVAAYRALTFRGGLELTPELEGSASASSLLEERRYRFQ